MLYRGSMKLGVFIERDGVLNIVRVERQHQVCPVTLEEMHVNTAAVPFLAKLKAAGLVLIATTNQPGLSRGYQNRREMDRMHDLLRKTFALDDFLVCPHDETDRCPCRKPKPGLLLQAAAELGIDLSVSVMIGDALSDVAAGQAAGCQTILLSSSVPYDISQVTDVWRPHTLEAAVDSLLSRAQFYGCRH